MLTDEDNKPKTNKENNPIQDRIDREFNGIVDNYGETTDHPLGDQESLQKAEDKAEAKPKQQDTTDPEKSFYNDSDTDKTIKQKVIGRFSKKTVAIGASSTLVGLIVVVAAIFGLLNSFKLDHIITNIENKAFVRYQVAMDARSSKWIEAYMRIRMMEIDGGKNTDPINDNILFRSNRVDKNNPATDWYKTMRASRFESDLADRYGIKFTSVAKKGPNGSIVFRPGVVKVNDKEIPFYDSLTDTEIRSIENLDVNGLNGRLRDFVDVTVFENDKAARIAIKNAVNENTHSWQVFKRRTLRKNIQNMTGVRDWRFFEKTRDKLSDKKIDIRNKFIIAAVPESTKSGKIVRCLFGIEKCRASTDPIDANNRSSEVVTDGEKNGSRTETDEDGNTVRADPSNGDAAVDTATPDFNNQEISGSIQKFFASEFIKKANIGTSIISILDSVARINESISDGSLISLVNMAKAAQAVGAFQVMSTARDQSKTGELTAEEYGEFMTILNNTTNNEGWQTVVEPNGVSTAKAEGGTFSPANNKEEYCSEAHQAELIDPANVKIAESEFHYLCDDKKIGSASGAENVTNWWNTFIGPIQPLLDAYLATPLASLLSGIDSIVGAVTGPIIETAVKAVGLEDERDAMISYLTTRVTNALGAGPMLDTYTPGGQIVNVMVEGAASSAEGSARFQGGVATTTETANYTNQLVAKYNDEQKYTNAYDKYIALSNTESVLSKALFNQVKDVNINNPAQTSQKKVASIVSMSLGVLSNTASAANNNNYAAAEFGGVKTYDIPQQCIDLNIINMKPDDTTNADELGVLVKEEITWQLVNNNTEFMDKVYEQLGDRDDAVAIADTIYNCGALDTAVRGSLGYTYNYTDDNGYEDATTKETSSGSDFVACEAENKEDIYWPTQPHPYSNTHDIGVPEGTKVYAITGGKVDVSKDLKGCDGRACNDGMYSYGRHIKIDHGKFGTVTYAHLKERKVKVGDVVAPGQLIGISGKSGNTYGSPPDHLHIDVDGNETLIPWLENKNAKKPPNPQCVSFSNNLLDTRKISINKSLVVQNDKIT